HRRMAVADMHRVWCRYDPLGRPRLATDDNVELTKIKVFQRQWHQWKIISEMALREGQLRDKRRADWPASDLFRDPVRIDEMREDLAIRKNVDEILDDFLATTHRDKPVVNDCYSHRLAVLQLKRQRTISHPIPEQAGPQERHQLMRDSNGGSDDTRHLHR